jgi:hypothetical protein
MQIVRAEFPGFRGGEGGKCLYRKGLQNLAPGVFFAHATFSNAECGTNGNDNKS